MVPRLIYGHQLDSSAQGTQLTIQAALHQRGIMHPSSIGDICTSWQDVEKIRKCTARRLRHLCREPAEEHSFIQRKNARSPCLFVAIIIIYLLLLIILRQPNLLSQLFLLGA